MNFYQVFRIKQNGHNVVAKTKRNCTNSNIFKEITSKHKKISQFLSFISLYLSISQSLYLAISVRKLRKLQKSLRERTK